MFTDLRNDAESIIDNAIETCYWMRGAIQYFEYYEMTYMERQKIGKFLTKRFKEESKKPVSMGRVY